MFSAQLRERAVRLVYEQRAEHASQWTVSVVGKIACTAQALQNCLWRHERDVGKTDGGRRPSSDAERPRQSEREKRALNRANEILKLASAFFPKAACPVRQRMSDR
jgi:transposase